MSESLWPYDSSVHGILQARILEWLAMSSSSISSLMSSALAGQFLTTSTMWANSLLQFSLVQSLSHVRLFATWWTWGLPAHHQLLDLLKLISIESVMPSNHLLLSPPFSTTLNLSQHQGLFKWVSSFHQVAKVLEFQIQHQSFQRTPRTDLL